MFQIGVLLGGRSTEHNISLRSGTYIYNVLDRKKFRVKPILIDREGEFYYSPDFDMNWDIPQDWIQKYSGAEYADRVKDRFLSSPGVKKFKPWDDPSFGDCSAIVIGLHGGEGEDGRIQAFLEMCNMPYTGSGVLASSLAMDKYRSNLIYQSMGIPVAPFVDIKREEFLQIHGSSENESVWDRFSSLKKLKFPVFTKPTTGGSSVGTFRSETKKEWEDRIRIAFETEERMLVQENIQGREVSCGVLERPNSQGWDRFSLPPTEIIPQTEFFDYEAKYTPGRSLEVTPPDMDKSWIEKIQNFSVLAHDSLGCRGYSRTDFILTEDGTPWILETNTLPGMTGTSLIPQQASVMNIDMKEVFTWLVRLALERKNIRCPWE